MDLKEMELKGTDWINLAQDRDECGSNMNMTENFKVLYNEENFVTRFVGWTLFLILNDVLSTAVTC